jgi:tetratricopeptide (TPR) repeat protein
LWGSSVQAADIERELDEIDAVVHEILQVSGRLELHVSKAGRGNLTAAEAISRYQDGVYLNLLNKHAQAAELFFGLVTAGALTNAGLHRDAEWYLAESLLGMGNLATAETRFLVISEDPQHPFREDAVRRLLELYAKEARTDEFDTMYTREILQGRVDSSDLVVYSVAKSFYHQRELDKAQSFLREITPESMYYGRAQYFLGAISVASQELEEAFPYFENVTALSVLTGTDQEVLDLSLLALGRIHYEQGEYLSATEYYNRVSGDPRYMPDKLYELVWTAIRREAFDEALLGVEIFLLGYPEHAYAARLALLQGNLLMAEVNYDAALLAYQSVIEEHEPVRDRFSELGASAAAQRDFFTDVIIPGVDADVVDIGLPAFAIAMMSSDPDLSRALDVFRELEQQEETITKSEDLVRILRTALEASTSLGGFEQLRIDAITNQKMITEQQMALLQLEERWLLESGVDGDVLSALSGSRHLLGAHATSNASRLAAAEQQLQEYDLAVGAVRTQMDEVRREAQGHQKELDAMRVALQTDTKLNRAAREALLADLVFLTRDLGTARGELDGLELALSRIRIPASVAVQAPATQEQDVSEDVDSLRKDYASRRVVGADDQTAARFDGLHNALSTARTRLGDVTYGLASLEQTELVRVRSRFEHEVSEVASQRVAFEDNLREAEQVSVLLTKDGFGRLEDFFAESVLKADMGIVDVFWSQKLEVSDEIVRVKEEKSELLSELERRFSLIRQKLHK